MEVEEAKLTNRSIQTGDIVGVGMGDGRGQGDKEAVMEHKWFHALFSSVPC